MSKFPFQKYLSTLLSIPPSDIVIERLTGGLTNFTSRATFNNNNNNNNNDNKDTYVCFPGSSTHVRSAIIKHAPPYIASIGPSQALSPKRQTVEANALKMLSESKDAIHSPLALVRSLHQHRVRIPELLFHDEKNNILVMTDLGRIPTLSEFLSTTQGDDKVTVDNEYIHSVCQWLGECLADLHGQTLKLPDDQFRPFVNPDSAQAIEGLVGTLPRKLLKLHDVADADVLGERVEEDMASERRVEDRCFGMVDLWPGSILIGDDFVGLVDWEYAGKSSPGSELGMLTAHLRIPLLSPTTPHALSENIRNFTKELLRVYFHRVSLKLYPWNFTRSMLLSHGRELINAVEFQSDDITPAQVSALIHAGARCLRAAACADVKEMRQILIDDEADFLHVF